MTARLFAVTTAIPLLIFSVLYVPLQITETQPAALAVAVPQYERPATLFFVGDIMLGRDVENYLKREGAQYPFLGVAPLIRGADIAVGNFEGVVTPEHVQTPLFTMQFSIKDTYLAALRDVGFDMLSLANNHSDDYGAIALNYTRTLCTQLQIFCGGSPTEIEDSYATTVSEVNSRKIGFIFLQAIYNEPTEAALRKAISSLNAESDVQIAIVHWGNEYELTHSSAQQQLAEKLIDFGIDAIIGHHPHVVQDVALYQGKPIFYSLGNFVFDQYFDPRVQEELGVRVKITDTEVLYTLVPLSTHDSRVQPQVVREDAAEVLYARILDNLKEASNVDTVRGTITVPNSTQGEEEIPPS